MNAHQFIQQLNLLSAKDWHAIANGHSVALKNDDELIISDNNTEQIIVDTKALAEQQADQIKDYVISQAEQFLQQYYLQHPLSQAGFNKQVLALISQHGIDKFISHDHQAAAFTLFVEGGEVIAEDDTSPRQPYGVCFKTESSSKDIKQQAMNWIHSGEAYELYLSMNVCRYNC